MILVGQSLGVHIPRVCLLGCTSHARGEQAKLFVSDFDPGLTRIFSASTYYSPFFSFLFHSQTSEVAFYTSHFWFPCWRRYKPRERRYTMGSSARYFRLWPGTVASELAFGGKPLERYWARA